MQPENGAKIGPQDVAWTDDLDVVIFAGCAVLDINDLNGNYDDDNADGDGKNQTGTEVGPFNKNFSGEVWANVGPQYLLGDLNCMNGQVIQVWTGKLHDAYAVIMVGICIFFGPFCRADDSSLSSAIVAIANDESINETVKAAKLREFAETHANTDSGRNALMLSCAILLETGSPTDADKALETSKKIARATRGTWQEGLATITFLAAMHAHGLSKEVRELGRYELSHNLEQKLNNVDKGLTPEMRQAFRFDTNMYLVMVREMVRISEDDLGIVNPVIQKLSVADKEGVQSKSENLHKVNQGMMGQQIVQDRTPNKMAEAVSVSNVKNSIVSIPWFCAVLLIIAIAGMLWLLARKVKLFK